MRALLITLALVLASSSGSGPIAQTPAGSPAQSPSIDDATLWKEFEQWNETLAHLPPGQRSTIEVSYAAWLVSRGVSKDEAAARGARIGVSRRGSVDRERLFWNAAFKLGSGPDQPLRLPQRLSTLTNRS